jgi:hypothetical protein
MPPLRRLNPGQMPTAEDWNALIEMAQRAFNLTVDPSSGLEVVRTGGGPLALRTKEQPSGTSTTTVTASVTSTTTTSTTTTAGPSTFSGARAVTPGYETSPVSVVSSISVLQWEIPSPDAFDTTWDTDNYLTGTTPTFKLTAPKNGLYRVRAQFNVATIAVNTSFSIGLLLIRQGSIYTNNAQAYSQYGDAPMGATGTAIMSTATIELNAGSFVIVELIIAAAVLPATGFGFAEIEYIAPIPPAPTTTSTTTTSTTTTPHPTTTTTTSTTT